jgi:dihydrofolate synthase/folylpolyglutamate synthase
MIHSFAEANAALKRFYNQPGSNTYTLDRMRALMVYLGNPQDKLRIVHVAGTSGKTSTVYYVSALLEASGATVGLTVSPHVNEVNERVQVNHAPLPESVFCSALEEFLAIVHQSGITPSYFECLVAFAFWQFVRIGVDYAVIEVGLGGLLDGTNVISREDKVCVITDIGFDHTHILGNTLNEIATQKAGIINEHNHVFMYQQSVDVMQAVNVACQNAAAELHAIGPGQTDPPTSLPLFQQRNFALAEQAARYVLRRDGIPTLKAAQIQSAASTFVPGRMEVHHVGGKVVIFDGAHNAQKMAALVASVQAAYPDRDVAALVSFVQGVSERWQPTLDTLAAVCHHFVVSSFAGAQDSIKASVPVTEVTAYLRTNKLVTLNVEPELEKACQALLSQPEPLLLVTGSLYLLSSARQLMGISSGA